MKKNRLLLYYLVCVILVLIAWQTGFFEESIGAMMAWNVTPLIKKSGEVSMPGFSKFVAFVPEHYVKTCPTVKPKEDGVSCELVGEFEFEEGKGFKYIDCTNGSVFHGSSTQGEEGSKSFVQKGGFYHPGSKLEAMEFAAEVINSPGFLITVDKDGRQIMVGLEGDSVAITCDTDFGKAATDAKGFNFSYEWDAPVPAYILTEPIDFKALKTRS